MEIYLSEFDKKRFWDKVDVRGEDECWEWKAGKVQGYGQFRVGSKRYNANQVAWVLASGQIPIGILVCHTCDNRGCENQKHLFLGTHKDNAQDAVRKGRFPTGENHWKSICPEGRAKRRIISKKKLKKSDVLTIRDLYKKGETQKNIAALFGVGQSNISRTVNLETWANI